MEFWPDESCGDFAFFYRFAVPCVCETGENGPIFGLNTTMNHPSKEELPEVIKNPEPVSGKQAITQAQGQGKSSRAARHWEKWEVALLGTMPDRKVATLIGRTLSAVQTMRITNLGLPCVSGRGRDWLPEEDRLLGTMPDEVLAERFDCCTPTIQRRRRILRIKRFRPIQQWTSEEEKLLGTDSDPAIARKLGRTVKSVRYRRHSLGVLRKPFDFQKASQRGKKIWAERSAQGIQVVNPDTKPWTPEEDKLLGAEPDDTLARKLGRSFIAVSYRRQQMKIPRYGEETRPWTAKEDELLGTRTDVAVAEKLNRTAIDVRWRRKTLGIKPYAHDGAKPWTDSELNLLGTKTDKEIARRLRRTEQAVRNKRCQLRIPAVIGPLWTDEEVALLGTMRDEQLARKLSRTCKAVQFQRSRRGIPCFNHKQKPWAAEDDQILGTRPDSQIAILLGRSTFAVARRRREKGIPAHPSQKTA